MENNVVCKARIKSGLCLLLILVYYIVLCVATFLVVKNGVKTANGEIYSTKGLNVSSKTVNGRVQPDFQYEYDYSKPPEYRYTEYTWNNELIGKKRYDVRQDILDKEGADFEGFSFAKDGKSKYISIIVSYIAFFVVLIPLFVVVANKKMSKKCSLELTEKSVCGKRKKLFSAYEMDLSIKKINNIFVKKGISDIMTGGKTVVICTSSEKYKYAWVRNADEFVKAVRQKMDEVQNDK